jgi:hypothetical protein
MNKTVLKLRNMVFTGDLLYNPTYVHPYVRPRSVVLRLRGRCTGMGAAGEGRLRGVPAGGLSGGDGIVHRGGGHVMIVAYEP